eukprot:XP_023156647.1 glutathione S-transferase T3-like [Zea mays]
MDSENEKLRKALATLLKVVQKRSCDIVDVVTSAFQPFNSPLVDELNRALVEIDDLAKDLEDVAVQTQWEVENMAKSEVKEQPQQEEAVEDLLIHDGSEDELLIDEESPINYEDLVGYDDGRDYSTDDTYPMGSDWNQVMSQYGSFLSQIDEQPIGTQYSEFPVDGQPEGSRTPAVTKTPTQRTKLANFTAEEDTRVCHAWLAVSCDPIINTGQKRQGFWSRITAAYNSRRGTLLERSTKSLMSRWDTIKTQCSTFAGYMMAVLRQNPSGLSDADKTSLAASRFAAIEKKPFHFLHCWAILKDQPKWMDNHMGQQQQQANANPTHSNTVDLDAEESVPSSFTSKRPLGRDASKEKAKRTKSVDTSSSDSEFMTRMGDLSLERLSVYKTAVSTEEKKLDSMNRNERQKLLLEKKKLNLEKIRLERQKLKEDKEEEIMILSMDLSKCNPLLRQYYEAKQQEILARVTGSTSSGQ